MTLRNLRIFRTVCDLGSVTAAAEKLYLSQPAVTIFQTAAKPAVCRAVCLILAHL